MHEFSIVSSLADTIRRHLPPGGRLRSATAAMGAFEHLDPVLMRTAWEAVMSTDGWVDESEPDELPRLELTTEAVRALCLSCEHIYAPPDPAWMVCPECGHARPRILQGVGITLLSLEVDAPASTSGPRPSNPPPPIPGT